MCDIDRKALNKVKKHPLYNKRIFISEIDASNEIEVIDFFRLIKKKKPLAGKFLYFCFTKIHTFKWKYTDFQLIFCVFRALYIAFPFFQHLCGGNARKTTFLKIIILFITFWVVFWAQARHGDALFLMTCKNVLPALRGDHVEIAGLMAAPQCSS